MDISNLTQSGSAAPSVTKAAEATGTNKPATQGNPLPVLGQVHADHAHSDISQDTHSQPNTKELHNLVDQANRALPAHASNLKFSVADGTNINVVRIEDTETGELIRQFPSEAMIAIARALEDDQQGMMLEEKA